MKIDRLEVVNLRFDYPRQYGFECAGGVTSARVTSLILVHADSRHVGIGSVYSHPALVHQIVMQQLDPMLRGLDAGDVEELWWKMYRLTRWYGRKGVAMTAIGGVDTALWDLRGKGAGKPVWELLGGKDPRVCAYASALLWQSEEELAAEAHRHLERGFTRMKMRLGHSEEYDVAAVRAVRRAIGKQHDVMCDGSMRYSLDMARKLGKVLAEEGVFWFEEPFEPEDLENFAALRGTVNVPIAAGENEFGLQGFRELILSKAVDIVQADASRCGGISEVCKVAALAARHGLRVAPHTWSDAVAVTANAHVVASLPNGITVEVDQSGNPFIEELLVEPLKVQGGKITLSNRPGLGVELNEQVVNRYRVTDPLRVDDGCFSDMIFGPVWNRPAGPYGSPLSK